MAREPREGRGGRDRERERDGGDELIDDVKGETLAAASSLEKSMREGRKTGANIEAAKAVGKLIAERAKEKGITDVVFDRGGYMYHGRIKALADAAREGGLNF